MDRKIELIEQNYEGISKMINSFRDLYAVGAPKEIVDKLLEYHSKPTMIINANGGSLGIGRKPFDEITNEDIHHLEWIFNRLNKLEETCSGEPDYMVRFRNIIQKLYKNEK